MTTLQPRPPYTPDELSKLYPDGLELQQVQIILRHGERTPVSARFQNAGLHPHWPYCTAATMLKHNILAADSWETMTWTRRLETFQRESSTTPSDQPVPVRGPKGEVDSICNPGELTDRGRETTLALGERLRALYIDRLQLLPSDLSQESMSNVHLRATPVPRALESTQQVFSGLYPSSRRAAGLLPPTIIQRSWQDETLFPNDSACKRLKELSKAFATRAAKIWNSSPEMSYINQKIGKYMPEESPVVKVDSHPRLSGVMDTVNATLGHGPATRLPSPFYDPTLRKHMDRIVVDEWFAGYQESNEYRKLGIGALVGDIVENLVNTSKGKSEFKLSLSGCHDTTIAATIASFGAYDVKKDEWPPYTSSIAVELFKQKSATNMSDLKTEQGWWSRLFFSPGVKSESRMPIDKMSTAEKDGLKGHFVRLRYNDRPLTLPYCQKPGNHHQDDETLCTLTAFKEAADSFTPKNWTAECKMNLGTPAEAALIERPFGVVA